MLLDDEYGVVFMIYQQQQSRSVLLLCDRQLSRSHRTVNLMDLQTVLVKVLELGSRLNDIATRHMTRLLVADIL